jgi:protein SCO1/2
MNHLRNLIAVSAVAVMASLALSCQRNGVPVPPPKATSAVVAKNYEQIFQVKGVIKELQPEKKKVTITHEEIPGYMEAMTMSFDVKDAQELNGLQPGDSVAFRMTVTDDEGWIDQLKKVDGPRTPLASQPTILRRVREVDPLAIGDLMPDYAFTNTSGRVVRLSDFKDQAFAFTFIFTRCPFPNFCPRLSSGFAEAQEKLKAMPGAPTNWHLLSITIDPDYDTPERLAAYSKIYKVDPARWDFVTADLIDITAIGEQFGLQFWRATANEPINHNVRTVVVDAAGRIQWVTNDNEWKPETLAEQIVKAAAAKPQG